MTKNHTIYSYVITGGPGTGKTTLLHALQAEGYKVVPEAARQIIQEQEACGGNALPWKDQRAYTDLMITRCLQDYQNASPGLWVPCFFDRGLPDALCYAVLIGYDLPVATKETVLACRHNPDVFLLLPWAQIYHNDNERRQTWEEALHTYRQMKKTYTALGYHITEVPAGDIQQRKQFVLNHIKKQLS